MYIIYYVTQLYCKNYFAETFHIRPQVGTLIYLIVLHKCGAYLYKSSVTNCRHVENTNIIRNNIFMNFRLRVKHNNNFSKIF